MDYLVQESQQICKEAKWKAVVTWKVKKTQSNSQKHNRMLWKMVHLNVHDL